MKEIQVRTEDELANCMKKGIEVKCKSTGPFGEDEGARVIAFGKIGEPDVNRKIEIDSDEMDEFGYNSPKEYLKDFEGTEVVVLDTTIGQTYNNFFMLDGLDIEDCDLYIFQ